MSRGDADRRAYEERARAIRERIAEGQTIDEIMSSDRAARTRELMEMTDREERESRERVDRR